MLPRRLVALACGSAEDRHNDIEVLVLRHQLAVLKRHVGRPRLRRRDRLFTTVRSKVLSRPRWSSFLVSPRRALSPDRSTVTFTTDLGGNVHIFAVNADGSGGLVQVTSGSGFEFGSSWSPDATKLVVDAEEAFGGPAGIAIVDVATGEMTPITRNPCGGFDAHPRFSLDGTQVLFIRGRCDKVDSPRFSSSMSKTPAADHGVGPRCRRTRLVVGRLVDRL